MSEKEGELYKKLVNIQVIECGPFSDASAIPNKLPSIVSEIYNCPRCKLPIKIATFSPVPTITQVLDEAKQDFPKKNINYIKKTVGFFKSKLEVSTAPFKGATKVVYPSAETYEAWFKKWFGDEK